MSYIRFYEFPKPVMEALAAAVDYGYLSNDSPALENLNDKLDALDKYLAALEAENKRIWGENKTMALLYNDQVGQLNELRQENHRYREALEQIKNHTTCCIGYEGRKMDDCDTMVEIAKEALEGEK